MNRLLAQLTDRSVGAIVDDPRVGTVVTTAGTITAIDHDTITLTGDDADITITGWHWPSTEGDTVVTRIITTPTGADALELLHINPTEGA